jgi:hypothetical protein
MIEAFAKRSGFRFRNLEIPSCPPLRSDPRPFVEPRLQRACVDSLRIVAPVVDRFDVVIMAASWSSYAFVSEDFLPTVLETARGLASAGKLVILIGKAPEIDGYDRRCREKALSYPLLACPDYGVPIPRRISEANARLRAFAQTTPNVRYFDATDYLCPHDTCPVFEPTGEPRYYDENHLTATASAKLGARIVAHQGVPAAFGSIPGWDASEAARSGAVR